MLEASQRRPVWSGPMNCNPPPPVPLAAIPPGFLDLHGAALRFILLGDPALVPLQCGSYFHLLEDIIALLLTWRQRLPWQGQGQAASKGDPMPRTLRPPFQPSQHAALPLLSRPHSRPSWGTRGTRQGHMGPRSHLWCCLPERRYSWCWLCRAPLS